MIRNTLLVSATILFFLRCEYERLELPDPCSQNETPIAISAITVTESECTFAIGAISIQATGGSEQFEYSLDEEVDFSENATFPDLFAGIYRVYVRDVELGCTLDTAINVRNENGLNLEEITTSVSGCGSMEGSLSLSVSNEVSPVIYSIEGIGTQTDDPVFENLSAGEYTVNITDDQGCEIRTEPITVLSGISFQNDILPIIQANCQNNSRCHVSGGVSPNFDSEEVILDRASRIFARTSAKTMPPSGPLSDDQISEITCWVNEGALSN